jgi:hypothetical protein
MKARLARTTASTKFMPGPAKTMRKRTQIGLRLKERAGSVLPVRPPSSGSRRLPTILT